MAFSREHDQLLKGHRAMLTTMRSIRAYLPISTGRHQCWKRRYEVEEIETLMAEAARQWLLNTNFEMKRLLSQFKAHGSDTINQIFEGYYQLQGMVMLKAICSALQRALRLFAKNCFMSIRCC